MRHEVVAFALTLALGLAGVLGATGCGHARVATPYVQAFSAGERAETAGRFAEAAERYDAAAQKAPSARERAHAEYAAATMLVRAGDLADAQKRLEKIAAERPATEHTPRAAYDLADMHITRAGEDSDSAGWHELEQMMLTFPNHGLARRALERLCAYKDRDARAGGKQATIAWLDAIEPRLDATELAESVLYQRAVRLWATGKLDQAHDAFLAIVARFPYPFGATFDDSLFHVAEIDEGRGRAAEAIDHLETMLKERETSSMMGSYERPRYVPALEKIARIYEKDLHDRARARDAWHRLYAEFTTSEERDDALWNEAELWRADGDASTACSRLATLVGDFPDSRYVPCASARCPGIARPKKSAAPATCHPYILEGRRATGAETGNATAP